MIKSVNQLVTEKCNSRCQMCSIWSIKHKCYEMTSEEFGKKHIPEQIDACFIDGVHTPPGVKVDIDLIASKVRKGGYIMFHDVNLYNLEPLIEIYEGKMFKFVEEEETEYLNGKPYGNIYVVERI